MFFILKGKFNGSIVFFANICQECIRPVFNIRYTVNPSFLISINEQEIKSNKHCNDYLYESLPPLHSNHPLMICVSTAAIVAASTHVKICNEITISQSPLFPIA